MSRRSHPKHPFSILGTIIFFLAIFTPMHFMTGLFLAIVCWSLGSHYEKDERRREQEQYMQTANPSYHYAPYANPQPAKTHQFCVECGTKYPMEYRFCNECGKQSQHRIKTQSVAA